MVGVSGAAPGVVSESALAGVECPGHAVTILGLGMKALADGCNHATAFQEGG